MNMNRDIVSLIRERGYTLTEDTYNTFLRCLEMTGMRFGLSIDEMIDVLKPVMGLADMPNEILFEITTGMSTKDIWNLCETSTRFQGICKDPFFIKYRLPILDLNTLAELQSALRMEDLPSSLKVSFKRRLKEGRYRQSNYGCARYPYELIQDILHRIKQGREITRGGEEIYDPMKNLKGSTITFLSKKVGLRYSHMTKMSVKERQQALELWVKILLNHNFPRFFTFESKENHPLTYVDYKKMGYKKKIIESLRRQLTLSGRETSIHVGSTIYSSKDLARVWGSKDGLTKYDDRAEAIAREEMEKRERYKTPLSEMTFETLRDKW